MSAPIAEVRAVRLGQPLAANGFPPDEEWLNAEPVAFCHDWQGKNQDPQRTTEVRLLWSEAEIYLRFRCRYRTIYVFPNAGLNGRRDALWDRDVAEVFLQPDRFGEKFYKEFEVSPNGQWLDLDITPAGLAHITSGLRSVVKVDEVECIWTADLAIPILAITPRFDSAHPWRVNFFRCEGVDPKRFYSAWQPTETTEPNFHVPQKFGWLRFGKSSVLRNAQVVPVGV
ncbi:MAG: carbohydrate-binding family 9-like protein [Candidatus Korobacteraceae bacterium]